MWTQSTSVSDGQTDGETDRQTDKTRGRVRTGPSFQLGTLDGEDELTC